MILVWLTTVLSFAEAALWTSSLPAWAAAVERVLLHHCRRDPKLQQNGGQPSLCASGLGQQSRAPGCVERGNMRFLCVFWIYYNHNNKEDGDVWIQARTGFPFIDAIMTQLRQEGWIHHLARHAVACFLTRGDLWISWEEGQKVFAWPIYLLCYRQIRATIIDLLCFCSRSSEGFWGAAAGCWLVAKRRKLAVALSQCLLSSVFQSVLSYRLWKENWQIWGLH